MKHAIRTTFERRYHIRLPWYVLTLVDLKNDERINARRIGAPTTHPYNGRRRRNKKQISLGTVLI